MTKRTAVIAAVTAIVVVGIGVVVVIVIGLYGGTPIIIRGSSKEGINLVMEKNVPSPNNKPDHTIFAEYTSIKLTSAPNKCMFYKFGERANFTIDLKTTGPYDELFLDDKDGVELVGVKFLEDRFNYDSAKKTYESKAARKIESLSIVVTQSECWDQDGQRIDCPAAFPNQWVTFEDLTIELGDGLDCS